MYKIRVSLLYFFLGSAIAFAQQPKKKTSSPKKEEEYKYAPSSKSMPSLSRQNEALTLLQEAENLKGSNPSLAIEKLEQALTINIDEGDRLNEAHCYRVLGAINLKRGLNELAIKNSQKALQIFQELKNENLSATARYQLAEAYYANGQWDEATPLYQDYIKYAEGQKLWGDAAKAKYKVAEIQNKKGNSGQALSTYNQILETEKKKGNEEGIAEANKKIGDVYQEKKQNKRALQYYKQAQDAAERGQDAEKYSEINENISKVLKEDKNYDDEIALRKRAVEISRDNKKPEVENKENIALANTYLDMNQAQTAIPYLQRSIEISDKLGKMKEKGEALKALSEAYTQQKKFEKAMQTFQKYLAIKDSLIKQKERQLEQMLNTNMALSQKQEKIDFLEKDVELNKQTIAALTNEKVAREERLNRQNTIIYSLGFGILLIIGASYVVYQNARKRRIANQLLALKSLRSQMNPHFIFNALNSVNAFISKNDEKSANKYLADFSRLMRMVMENSQHDFVPLSQEIDILELYLGLEHFRFKEKFEYTFTVDDTIDTDACEVPPMLIQPYIENAVWHGIRYKTEKGKLEVHFRKNPDNSISIIIKDNGVGRRKSEQLKTSNQKSGKSTGIKNTVSRVSLINDLYHKNIRIDIQDLFPNEEETGTDVTISLPGK